MLFKILFLSSVKLILTLVLIDVSVSNPLNYKMEEKRIIAVVTFEMFVLTDNNEKIKTQKA